VPARHQSRSVEFVREHGRQDVVDQGGFAGAGHPGHRGQHPERERDVDLAQVVLAGADDGELALLVDRAAQGRDLDLLFAGQIGPGQ
jgi:hypothetical protein